MARHRQAGVTLLEMLTVIAVIAVLAGAALALMPAAGRAPDRLAEFAEALDSAAEQNVTRATGLMLDWSRGRYAITLGQEVLEGALPPDAAASAPPPYGVTPLGLPQSGAALTITVAETQVVFDGLSARIEVADAF